MFFVYLSAVYCVFSKEDILVVVSVLDSVFVVFLGLLVFVSRFVLFLFLCHSLCFAPVLVSLLALLFVPLLSDDFPLLDAELSVFFAFAEDGASAVVFPQAVAESAIIIAANSTAPLFAVFFIFYLSFRLYFKGWLPLLFSV